MYSTTESGAVTAAAGGAGAMYLATGNTPAKTGAGATCDAAGAGSMHRTTGACAKITAGADVAIPAGERSTLTDVVAGRGRNVTDAENMFASFAKTVGVTWIT